MAFALVSCGGSGQATDNEKVHHDPQESASVAEPANASAPSASAPETIPSFTFYKLNSGMKFTQSDLAKTGNIVFIFFDPGCSHCQQETSDLSKNYEKVKDANFYFISMQDPSLMEDFLSTYGSKLQGRENVTLLYDRNVEFLPKFNPTQYPAVYIYGSDHKLRDHWNGEKKVDAMIKGINSI